MRGVVTAEPCGVYVDQNELGGQVMGTRVTGCSGGGRAVVTNRSELILPSSPLLCDTNASVDAEPFTTGCDSSSAIH
jgi:hypothetical protein